MSITAAKHPGLLAPNGRRLRKLAHGASKFAQINGMVGGQMRADIKARTGKDDAQNAKRAKLMLVAKANLHITTDCPRGSFTLIDPAELPEVERALAEANGLTSRTLVLHPDDLDRCLEQFSRPAQGRAN